VGLSSAVLEAPFCGSPLGDEFVPSREVIANWNPASVSVKQVLLRKFRLGARRGWRKERDSASTSVVSIACSTKPLQISHRNSLLVHPAWRKVSISTAKSQTLRFTSAAY